MRKKELRITMNKENEKIMGFKNITAIYCIKI